MPVRVSEDEAPLVGDHGGDRSGVGAPRDPDGHSGPGLQRQTLVAEQGELPRRRAGNGDLPQVAPLDAATQDGPAGAPVLRGVGDTRDARASGRPALGTVTSALLIAGVGAVGQRGDARGGRRPSRRGRRDGRRVRRTSIVRRSFPSDNADGTPKGSHPSAQARDGPPPRTSSSPGSAANESAEPAGWRTRGPVTWPGRDRRRTRAATMRP